MKAHPDRVPGRCPSCGRYVIQEVAPDDEVSVTCEFGCGWRTWDWGPKDWKGYADEERRTTIT